MRWLIVIAMLGTLTGRAQKTLDLRYTSLFGRQKSFQFFTNQKFTYKRKGELFYHTHKLVNLQDSLLVFDNDSVLKLGQIKAIRIAGLRLSPLLFGAGARFLLLDTGHGLIFGRSQVLSDQALIVAGSCVVGGLLVGCLQNKHVRIKKSTTMRIFDSDYRNLQPVN